MAEWSGGSVLGEGGLGFAGCVLILYNRFHTSIICVCIDFHVHDVFSCQDLFIVFNLMC